MRIEQLEYITAVTRHGSLRRASEHLHISQPALSEAVSKLERELGVNLLDRHRSGARISQRGRALLQDMTDVLDAVDRLRANAGRPRRSANTLTLGTVGAASATLLAPTIQDLAAALPDTQVEVVAARPAEVMDALTEGAIDIGLLDLLPGDDPPPELARHRIARGEAVVVLPHGHPLTSEPMITATQLREARLVAMSSGHPMHRLSQRLLGPDLPPVAASADGADLAKAMVAEGLGVTLLPDYTVVGDPLETSGRLQIRPLAARSGSSNPGRDDRGIELVAVGRREATRSTPVKALINALRERSASGRTPSDAAIDRGLSTG